MPEDSCSTVGWRSSAGAADPIAATTQATRLHAVPKWLAMFGRHGHGPARRAHSRTSAPSVDDVRVSLHWCARVRGRTRPAWTGLAVPPQWVLRWRPGCRAATNSSRWAPLACISICEALRSPWGSKPCPLASVPATPGQPSAVPHSIEIGTARKDTTIHAAGLSRFLARTTAQASDLTLLAAGQRKSSARPRLRSHREHE